MTKPRNLADPGPPNSMEELQQRIRMAQVIIQTHDGIAIREACPFCGAPDFMILTNKITLEQMLAVRTCAECSRQIKGQPKAGLAQVQHVMPYVMMCGWLIEFVQVAGPEQPEWLEPKMRRMQ